MHQVGHYAVLGHIVSLLPWPCLSHRAPKGTTSGQEKSTPATHLGISCLSALWHLVCELIMAEVSGFLIQAGDLFG